MSCAVADFPAAELLADAVGAPVSVVIIGHGTLWFPLVSFIGPLSLQDPPETGAEVYSVQVSNWIGGWGAVYFDASVVERFTIEPDGIDIVLKLSTEVE